MISNWWLAGAFAAAASLVAVLAPRGVGSSPPDPYVRIVAEVPAVEFPLVVTASTSIVHGRVTHRESRVPPRGLGHTTYTLDVLDTWKGAHAERATFGVLGTLDGRVTLVGAPRFELGDEIVALLHTDAAGVTGLLGLEQGVRRVVRRGTDCFYRERAGGDEVPLANLRTRVEAMLAGGDR